MSRSYNFCFTWNNPPTNPSFPKNKYLLYGREISPTTNTPHLQGLIIFHSNKTLSAAVKSLPGCHVETTKDLFASIKYCKKDGDFFEEGKAPVTKEEKGQLGALVYKEAFENAKMGRLEEIPEILRLRFYRTFKEIKKDYMVKPQDADDTTGVWLWGAAGAGKSRQARETYPNSYFKRANKWWDGYQNEDFVIVDDLDLSHSWIAYDLKIWADRYSFLAECKGGAMNIRPKKIIVTSQYTPDQIWSDDETRRAIHRRFAVQEIIRKQH